MRLQKKTSNRLNVAAHRRRNKAQGLCHCGNPRSVDVMTGKVYKTCSNCYNRIQRRTVAKNGATPPIVTPQRNSRKRAYTKLIVDVEPELLDRVNSFLVEFDDMPLADAIAEGLELLMHVTREAEDVLEVKEESIALRLVR